MYYIDMTEAFSEFRYIFKDINILWRILRYLMLIFFPEQQWYLGLHLWEDSNDGAEDWDVKTDEGETKCQRGLCIYIGNPWSFI